MFLLQILIYLAAAWSAIIEEIIELGIDVIPDLTESSPT